jgi:hypothetical protein
MRIWKGLHLGKRAVVAAAHHGVADEDEGAEDRAAA